jgi:hypothetical protein
MSALDDLIETYQLNYYHQPKFSRNDVRTELAQLRANVETNLLKAAAMVDAMRGKCVLQPMDKGYMPEIEEAKQLAGDKKFISEELAKYIALSSKHLMENKKLRAKSDLYRRLVQNILDAAEENKLPNFRKAIFEDMTKSGLFKEEK